jgi:polysaccharide biosynthesis protein PslG
MTPTALRRTAPLATARLVIGFALLVIVCMVLPAAVRAQGVATGLVDERLMAAQPQTAALRAASSEDTSTLHADWVRLTASWSALEPAQGTYDEAGLEALDAQVDDVRAQGGKVMFVIVYTPQWASDRSFWNKPLNGVPAGYRPGIAMDPAYLPALSDFAHMLAVRYAGRVQAVEAWNEPNMFVYLSPQRTTTDPHFGVRLYLRMLEAVSAGVRRSSARMQVVAGSTTSLGQNDVYRTDPLTWAEYLRQHGATRFFDAYSHHPYVPAGTADIAPGGQPNDPTKTVLLGNLGQLLRIFPSKPFYLTEFGYSTKPNIDFGGLSVSEKTQARFLTQSYAVASRYPQVKALFWFLAQDTHPQGAPSEAGCYTGLRRLDGSKKPSWYAFRALP